MVREQRKKAIRREGWKERGERRWAEREEGWKEEQNCQCDSPVSPGFPQSHLPWSQHCCPPSPSSPQPNRQLIRCSQLCPGARLYLLHQNQDSPASPLLCLPPASTYHVSFPVSSRVPAALCTPCSLSPCPWAQPASSLQAPSCYPMHSASRV